MVRLRRQPDYCFKRTVIRFGLSPISADLAQNQ